MTAEIINRIALSIGAFFWIVLAVFCAIVGDDLVAKVLNASLLILGSFLGVLVGFLISPEEDEQKNFTIYSKYIFVFLTGYLSSKLNPAIDGMVAGISADEVVGFRVVVVLASFVFTVVGTFVVRRYPV